LKLKIFYVYYHSYEDMPIHVSDVVEEFVRQGDEVHLFTSVKSSVLKTSICQEQINITNFPVTKLNWLNRLCYSLLLLVVLPICCLLEKPTIIYERASISALLTVLISRVFHIPYVCEINGILVEELALGRQASWRISVTQAWERLVYNRCHLLVAVTDSIKDYLSHAYRIPSNRIEVVTNGTNIHRFRSVGQQIAREHFRLPSDGRLYIGYLGTLTPWCGVELLIDCAPMVLGRWPQIEFLIGGGYEPDLSELKKRVKSKGLQNHFRFFGPIPWNEAALFISAFDVAVLSILPLRSGASPQKLFSYLACSRPVIGSDMGMVGDVLRQHDLGLTFAPGSPDSLAEKITELLNNPERRADMGRRARQLVLDHYSWSVKVRQIREAVRNHFLIGTPQ
jgi:glycosyltransferase involved in cell wall biosynthesis